VDRLGVYLVRHEDAEPAGDGSDAHRGLTGHGRRRMRSTGRFVAVQPPDRGLIDYIKTSPFVRAVQTAEILAGAIGLDDPVIVTPELAHPPSIRRLVEIATDVPAYVQGVALVGHEPTLSHLFLMLVPEAANYWRGFDKGEVVALAYSRAGKTFGFEWRVAPDGPTLFDQF
jgi:phosphohistidine phosphatase